MTILEMFITKLLNKLLHNIYPYSYNSYFRVKYGLLGYLRKYMLLLSHTNLIPVLSWTFQLDTPLANIVTI